MRLPKILVLIILARPCCETGHAAEAGGASAAASTAQQGDQSVHFEPINAMLEEHYPRLVSDARSIIAEFTRVTVLIPPPSPPIDHTAGSAVSRCDPQCGDG